MGELSKLSVLSDNYNELIEALELIAISLSLRGIDYVCYENKDIWVFDCIDSIFYLDLPKVCSEFKPASLRVNIEIINSIENKNEFEKELKEQGIVYNKQEQIKRRGYITMGVPMQDLQGYWQFFFPKQNKLYDFYLIGQKYGIF